MQPTGVGGWGGGEGDHLVAGVRELWRVWGRWRVVTGDCSTNIRAHTRRCGSLTAAGSGGEDGRRRRARCRPYTPPFPFSGAAVGCEPAAARRRPTRCHDECSRPPAPVPPPPTPKTTRGGGSGGSCWLVGAPRGEPRACRVVTVGAGGQVGPWGGGGEACLCRRPPPRAVSSACVTHGRVMTRIGDLARGMWPGPPSMTGGRQRRLVARLLCPHWRGKQAWA